MVRTLTICVGWEVMKDKMIIVGIGALFFVSTVVLGTLLGYVLSIVHGFKFDLYGIAWIALKGGGVLGCAVIIILLIGGPRPK